MNAMPRSLPSATVCALLFYVLLAGCSTHNSTADVMVVDGCMIEIKGLSATQASDIAKTWTFGDDCSLISTSELGPGDE